jgi:hypothetical protein
MPSSDLAYKALYAALDTKSRSLQRVPSRPDTVPQQHDDVFVEASGPTSAIVYMFIVRSTTTYAGGEVLLHRYGVFANVDKRAASAPRIDNVTPDDANEFLEALPALSLRSDSDADQTTGNVSYEVRVRNVHADLTMHFANPRRADLVALANAARRLIAFQTS